MASNFRALFTIQYNQFAKHAKGATELWPLSIDSHKEELNAEDMYARNKRVIESME